MSGLPANYTPLESLLLFQSLVCYGVDPPVFARVSDLLTNNDAVKSAPTFSPDRLTPDALRDLYLCLLKEEVRDELQPQTENEPPVQNGDSPSRKRKLPSPSLPSVQEAAQHQHLLPKLIQKLYARYRRHAIDEIREHEKRYEHYSRELRAIQNGDWDERLQSEHLVNGTKEAPQPSPPAEASPAAAPQPPAEVAPQEAQGPVKPAAGPQASPPGSKEQSPTLSQQSQAPRRSSAKIESIINHPSGSPVNGSASPHQKSAAQSPVQPQAQTQPPPHQRTPSHPQQAQQPATRPPHQQPPQGPYPSPYGPPHTSPPVGSPNAHNVQVTSRPPQGQPVILPPPPNMPNVQYPPPPLQVPSMQEGNGTYRPSSGSPHQHQQRPFPPGPPQGPPPHSPNAQAPPPHVQGPGYYPQYPGPHPYPHHHPMYHPPVQHPPMPPRGGGGGVILEPFQVMAQDPVQAHKAQERQMRQQQAAAARPPSRPQPSPRNTAASPARGPQLPQPFHPSPGQHPLYPHPNAAQPIRRPPALRVNTRFGSWKQPLPHDKPVSEWNPTPPSPITPERSPELQSGAPPGSTSKSKRAIKSKEMPAPDAAETPKPGRSSRKNARKARGTSVASSAVTGSVRGRTRSQSVTSHADEPATDVKAEPSTPAETMESDAQSTTETPTSGGRRTRRRAGTLQSVPEQSHAANNKRKRDQREESETAEPDVPEVDMNMGTPGPPNFVVASRNFARMSVPVMNDIASHKHASLFSNPVKAKDAEGYYDIIRRPQDLKSIRAAVAQGSRAVAAATQSNADTPSANSPGGAPSTPTQFSNSSTQITLPISEELVPPKGIVNSAQLEKELMRMFANAVMFNSGEDGVVSDAIEMARDVEASVANWRAAERTSVYDTANASTPAEGDLNDDGGGKRRKV